MRTSLGVVLTVFGIGGGFATGWLARPLQADAEAESGEVDASPPNSRAQRIRDRFRRFLCVTRPEGGEADETTGDALRWCETQLAGCERRQRIRRQPWPEEDTVESPTRWVETVEQSLRECEFPLSVEVAECTEYPCVAAFRAPPAEADESPEQTRAKLQERLRACAPLRAAFGGDKLPDDAVDIFRYDVPCGEDTKEDLFVMMALDADGPALDVMMDVDNESIVEVLRWMFRRGDDLSAVWHCVPPEDR